MEISKTPKGEPRSCCLIKHHQNTEGKTCQQCLQHLHMSSKELQTYSRHGLNETCKVSGKARPVRKISKSLNTTLCANGNYEYEFKFN